MIFITGRRGAFSTSSKSRLFSMEIFFVIIAAVIFFIALAVCSAGLLVFIGFVGELFYVTGEELIINVKKKFTRQG